MNEMYFKQMFAVEENQTATVDVEPAISIDHTSRLVENIKSLQAVLGITEMVPMAAGTIVKRYKTVKENTPDQVDEGEVIPLTKITRKALDNIELTLKKYRKLVTAEAIQKTGYNVAVNETDAKLISEVRKDVKDEFFSMIAEGTGEATSADSLQKACANLWASIQTYYEDMDVTPVFFINPIDVATYLGSAAITTQTAFGFSYLENFLGMGNAIISSKVAQGKVYATVTQNLNGVYVPAGGDLANAFGLTYDESGLVGMNHTPAIDRASLNTLLLCGVVFYPEDVSGVFVGSIAESTTAEG